MSQTVLLTGGTGLIGSQLADHLYDLGFEVRILSRNPSQNSKFKLFHWDIFEKKLDMQALFGVDVIIALAGASIASDRWSEDRKKVLYRSRIDGNMLLFDAVKRMDQKPGLFIGTSAVGIYGDRGKTMLDESSEIGSPSFLVDLCQSWEESIFLFEELKMRVGLVRVGLVLSDLGGVLPTLKKTTILGIGSYIGSGLQYMPWVHIEDLINIYCIFINEHETQGIINGVGPDPVTNKQFMKTLVQSQKGFGITFPTPSFLIKMVMGQRSALVLNSNRVISKKIQSVDYNYKFNTLKGALEDLSN